MNIKRGTIILCGSDRLVWDDADCPQVELHTPAPTGYVAWFEWAGRQQAKGRRQRRCPGCNRYAIVDGAPMDICQCGHAAEDHRVEGHTTKHYGRCTRCSGHTIDGPVGCQLYESQPRPRPTVRQTFDGITGEYCPDCGLLLDADGECPGLSPDAPGSVGRPRCAPRDSPEEAETVINTESSADTQGRGDKRSTPSVDHSPLVRRPTP